MEQRGGGFMIGNAAIQLFLRILTRFCLGVGTLNFDIKRQVFGFGWFFAEI